MSWAGMEFARSKNARQRADGRLIIAVGFKKNVNRATTQVMMKTGIPIPLRSSSNHKGGTLTHGLGYFRACRKDE